MLPTVDLTGNVYFIIKSSKRLIWLQIANIDEESLSIEEKDEDDDDEEEERSISACNEDLEVETVQEVVQQVATSSTISRIQTTPTIANIPTIANCAVAGDSTRKRKDTFSIPMQRIGIKARSQSTSNGDNTMDQYLKYMMVQRQLDNEERKEEQRIRREDERLRWEQHNLHREDERLCSEQQNNMMQMMTLGFMGGRTTMQQNTHVMYANMVPPIISVATSQQESEMIKQEHVNEQDDKIVDEDGDDETYVEN